MISPILLAAFALAAETDLAANNYALDAPMALPSDAKLVWSDEFDGAAIDGAKWSFDTHRNKDGWYNDEAQYYSADRPANARVEDGRLIIEARHDPEKIRKLADWGGQKYSSARMVTKGKAAWTYGFYEIRAKLPCARGTWPAIWMLPEAGGWPDGGEIDILEHVGSRPNFAHANLHTGLFNHVKGTGRGAEIALPTSCSAFHRYQLDWRPDVITIGIDDRAYFRVRNDQPGGRGAWPFDRPFHMILNLAIGGGWAGSRGIDDEAMPEALEVDYVRVWTLPEE